jgi:calcium-dependent protein kinase
MSHEDDLRLSAIKARSSKDAVTSSVSVKTRPKPAGTGPSLPIGSETLTEEKEREVLAKIKDERTIWIFPENDRAFDKDYSLGDKIGSVGAYGDVRICLRKTDGQKVVCKGLAKAKFYKISRDEMRVKYLRDLVAEIDVMRLLAAHPNIVTLHDVYEDKPTLRLVMELCEGGELFALFRKGPMTEVRSSSIIKQIANVLKYMHEEYRVIHADLKPSNILFADKEQTQIKIIDFGMAKVLDRLKFRSDLAGTPYYMAPEVCRAKPQYAHPSDMWSLGCILFTMVFAFPPFIVDQRKYTGREERKAIFRKIAKGFYPRVLDVNKYGFGPWFPSDTPCSAYVQDLIAHLLRKEVDKRYTANDVLMHPFVLGEGDPEKMRSFASTDDATTMSEVDADESMLPKAKHVITSLAKFTRGCLFREVVVRLFEDHYKKMRPHQFASLEKLFKEMDGDGDGILSYDEFQSAMQKFDPSIITETRIQSMFDELASPAIAALDTVDPTRDADDSKEAASRPRIKGADAPKEGIKFGDLLNAVIQDYLSACDDRLWSAFMMLDDKGDGMLDVEVLLAKFAEIDSLGEIARAQQIIEMESLSQDGKINYQEFLRMLHPDYNEVPEWIPELYVMESVSIARDKKKGKKEDRKEKKDKKKLKSEQQEK